MIESVSHPRMASVLRQKLISRPCFGPQLWVCGICRTITSGRAVQAGHSKWANTKHVKSRNDAAKSKERQIISQEIMQASKLYGSDPGSNPKLAAALTSAKRSGMSKSTMDSAIAKGQGVSMSGAPLESLTIEAMMPGSVAVVIECQTDQKGRTLQDVRHMIKEAGGNVTPTTFLFEKKGRIVFERDAKTSGSDDYLEAAIDAGATDVDTDTEERLVLYTEPTMTNTVGEAFSTSTGLRIESRDIIWDPNKDTMVTLSSEEAALELNAFLDDIREENTVQEVYMNLYRS